MGWPLSHVVPGPRLSSPHTCWPTWNGGAPIITDVASPCSAAVSTHAASRTKGQTSRATLPAAYPSYGRRGNHPTVDSKGSPVLPSSTCPMLYHVSVHGARRRSQNGSVRLGEWGSQGGAGEPTRCIGLCVQSFEKKICRTCVCRGLIELSTISNGSAGEGKGVAACSPCVPSWESRARAPVIESVPRACYRSGGKVSCLR